MQYLVLDASAAIQVVCDLPAAARILDVLAETTLPLAPDLYAVEVANALWKYVRFDSISREEAGQCFTEANNLVEFQVASGGLAEEALMAAATYEHPVYDMLYAVLARRHGAPVLTMDRRFTAVLRKMSIEPIQL